jgi:hypothetical protein
LRGVSAISQEALKMSYSTLDDYYRGMKMPAYDGKNIYHQMRSLNAHTTVTGQIHEEHRVEEQTYQVKEQRQSSLKKMVRH